MPKGKPNKRYTPEFKVMVVETMRKERLSHKEASMELSTSVQSKNTQNSNSSRSGGTDRVDATKSIDNRR